MEKESSHEHGTDQSNNDPQTGFDHEADEILGTLQLMIEAGEITAEEAAELFQSGTLND